MNILYHCSEYPGFKKGGGIGTVTKIVAEEMARRGHCVYVAGYYPDMNCIEHIDKVNGVTILQYNMGLRRGYIRSQLAMWLNRIYSAGFIIRREHLWYEKKLQEVINKNAIQLIELTDFYNMNIYRTHLTFKKFNVPTVMRIHGSISFIEGLSGRKNSCAFINDKNHFLRADYLSSVSIYSQKYIDDTFKLSHYKIKQVIYNPIDNDFIKKNAPNDNHVILFIGKLIETKGAYAVLHAFNDIIEMHPDWKLRLAGRGDVNVAKKHLTPKALNHVDFLGFCDRTSIMSEIDNCSFACIPSFFENFSMVPLEIMGRCRTVIFTKRTSGGEIVKDGVDGFTVEPSDINEIVEKMNVLIENKDVRDAFAEKGFAKVVSSFTADAIITDMTTFYSACIEDWNNKEGQ